jgi:peptidyl-dipeptidase A
MKFFIPLALIALLIMGVSSCGENAEQLRKEEIAKMEQEFSTFADSLEKVVAVVYTDVCTKYWEASLNSNEENWNNYSQADMKFNEILADKSNFESIKKYRESNNITDPLMARRLEVLYLGMLSKQIDTAKLNQLSAMQAQIENKYSNYRAKVGNKALTDNQVEEVLKTSKNQKELQATWLAHKDIGPVVREDILNLVRLRNEIAHELGYKNYHEMSLRLSEQDPEQIEKLFDELDGLTRDTFVKLKGEIDTFLAAQNKIKVEQLMPWHYQNRYFQEAPKIYEVDLDKYYKDQDLVKLSVDYFKSLNLPIDNLVAKSDLFEKPNKNQHAYCINIDRDAKDIRVLCNVVPNSRWGETMLHEYGHALYEYHYDAALPWSLKEPAHIFTTEAIAMLFGRMASDPSWMQSMIGISAEEKESIAATCHNILKMQQLVFSRWSQVMYRFEKELYANPEQDLNTLWWSLVEKYQMMKKPEGRDMPDWATKIHIATSPCYYHNYHLGELLASQLYNTITTKVLKDVPNANPGLVGHPEVGEYLIKNVFQPGKRYLWNEMIEKATGEKLTPKYYAIQFVD